MILSVIFHFLKSILGAAIKLIAWLLVSLSLWVPLLYTVIFVAACGITGASLTALQAWFFAGLAVSFIGSFAVSTYLYERNLKRKKQQKVKSSLEKVTEKETETSGTSGIKKKKGYIEQEVKAIDQPVEPLPEPTPNIVNEAKSTYESTYTNDTETKSTAYNSASDSPYTSKHDLSAKHGFQSYDALKGLSESYSAPPAPPSNPTPSATPDYNQGYQGYQGQQDYKQYGGYNQGNQNYQNQSSQNYQQNYNGYNQNSFSQDYNQPAFSQPVYEAQPYSQPEYRENRRGEFGINFENTHSSRTREDISGGYDEYKTIFNSPVLDKDDDPEVFAVRNDPTVFVYEFADRLEYYKRTREGMVLMETKRKAQ